MLFKLSTAVNWRDWFLIPTIDVELSITTIPERHLEGVILNFFFLPFSLEVWIFRKGK